MLLIGESINGTIPKVGKAILEKDKEYIQELAIAQKEMGADFLDVNGGIAEGNESEDLSWIVRVVQESVDLPLMIDSANPDAIKKAISFYNHKIPPFINSISAETKKWKAMHPVIKGKDYKIVALCLGDKGIPPTVKGRVEIAQNLYDRLTQIGVKPENIYFDPLVMPISTDSKAALVTLDTIKILKDRFPSSKTICGVSNISMGLPLRSLINRNFLTMALLNGLDVLLMDVRDKAMISNLLAAQLLLGEDNYGLNYIKAFRSKILIS
ncbi:MAG: dihydropteroate synthase [Deltaproteobacteria bacterium]|nr:dihydropteroate synthase [Deltaproteobacteria bacterium]